MLKIINKIKNRNEFIRNVLTLISGTVVAQSIPILISPLLTRIYTPENFGTLALFTSLVSIISIISTARYEIAIVLPKSNRDAINILALSLIIVFLVTFIVFFGIILFKEELIKYINNKDLEYFIYLVPLSVLLAGIYQSFYYWFNRKKQFSTISSSQIIQSVTISFSQILLGFIRTSNGLILGNIIGRIITTFYIVKIFLKNDKDKSIKYINIKRIFKQLVIYKDFPLINSLHAFSDILRTSISMILISSYFGSTTLGYYSLAVRVLQVPVGMLGSAISQVLYKKITDKYNNGENVYKYIKIVILWLIILSLPIFGIFYFLAVDLFTFMFGEQWYLSGEYSKILIPYLFLNFLVSPISYIPIVFGKQKQFFLISMVGNLGMPLIIYTLYEYGFDFIHILCWLSAFLTIYSLFILLWILKISKGKN
ncbi:lipopolysaccharide biosynthesis protein [Persephonella sp.]